MSFDKDTRNLLAKAVAACRRRLIEDVTDQLRGVFGLHPDGAVLPLDKLTHLSPDQNSAARRLRDLLDHYTVGAAGKDSDRRKVAYERMVLEISFTVLNRLAALRLCEERGLVVECVRKGTTSAGFQMFERITGGALGGRYDTYRVFLECMFDELAGDLGVLFDRMTPQSAVFPSERCMEGVIAALNKPELTHLWTEDETIGWVYQYFNPPEERKAMREASQAPRNSRELAVRNQFFTPRYVVEFLTDNTLGRIWYEMHKGDTVLKEECRYLVRRPNEVFLGPGEKAPAEKRDDTDLSQEELLKRPVYIEQRLKKDPRDLRILDPACGSGHFLLYAFDLLEHIYAEAWPDVDTPNSEVTGRTLQEDFKTLDDLRREVPKLIVEHNLHGIDIDPRAVQIAALALWLRAQKTWKNLGLKADARPRIAKSNIVTAEPMPGEEDMRREFTAGLKPRVLGQIVDEVFEKMKLAGEAGSLLKIEEEITDAVAAAGKQWREGPKPEQQLLFPTMDAPRPKQQELRFDVKGITDVGFWEQAEDRILDALKEYAERAENGHATRRRLFAEDAARGFAFIDLCRKRYDTVVMNPPFGQAIASSAKYFKSAFGKAAFDLFASFLEGGLKRLEPTGAIGAITTSAGFYRNQVEEWRSGFFLDGSIRACADLGGHVLDGATVRAATYVRDASPRAGDSVFIRCNESSDKEEALFGSIKRLCAHRPPSNVFILDARLLKEIPGSPLAYWLPERFRREVANLQRFADAGGEAQFGLSTKDDFRFLRLAWEAPAVEIGREKKWCYTSKGGSYSPFYFDIHLLTLHQNDFQILEQAILKKYPYLGDSAGWVLHRENHYYSPGLTFQRRTNKPFAPRALPVNCLFTDNGPTAFWQRHSLPAFLGLFNSSVVKLLAAVGNGALEAEGGGGANSYEVGIINNIVVPELPDDATRDLEKAALQIVNLKQAMDSGRPETRVFLMPQMCRNLHTAITTHLREIAQLHERIDNLVSPYYGFAPGEVEDLLATVSPRSDEGEDEGRAAEEESETEDDVAIESGDDWHNSASYFLGACFGRWDIRYATGERQPPELPDPFDPLPVCPPGMLQNADGLPSDPKDVSADYPLSISWDGVLVDDSGFNGDRPHRDDIVRRVREVFDLLWKDKALEIEQEACDILGVSDLRDYFRKPTGFFQDHLKRYSKSRRKAPIYWPLSTPSGLYTIWLYYHHLTDQMIYGAVNEYVEPKILEVERGIGGIENDLKSASGRDVTRLTDRLSEARTFLSELRDLREELLRIAALPFKPDLNDGVIINASPFHNLFRLRTWAKDTAECWKKLEKGDYDWAHLAYITWPDRVREVCKTDRSIAIAHGLEYLCEVEVPAAKKKGGSGRRSKKIT